MSDRTRFIATVVLVAAPLGLVCCAAPFVAPALLAGLATWLAAGERGLALALVTTIVVAGYLLRRDLHNQGKLHRSRRRWPPAGHAAADPRRVDGNISE